jgi:hypothetical protein
MLARNMLYFLQEVKLTARNLFWDVIDVMCLEIGQEVKGSVNHLLAISQSVCYSVIAEVVAEFVT